MKKLKLNVGCGRDKKPGYVNLDIDPSVNPDKIYDITTPLPYDDESVQHILLKDVLEHVTKEQADQVVHDFDRVLKTGGTLHVRVPNVHAIIRKFFFQPDLQMLYIYGDTSENGVWGAHKFGYTPFIFRQLLEGTHLHVQQVVRQDTNYLFRVTKRAAVYNIRYRWLEDRQIYTAPIEWLRGEFLAWRITSWPKNRQGELTWKVFSRFVQMIEVPNKSLAKKVQTKFHFSHLRVSIARAQPKN